MSQDVLASAKDVLSTSTMISSGTSPLRKPNQGVKSCCHALSRLPSVRGVQRWPRWLWGQDCNGLAVPSPSWWQAQAGKSSMSHPSCLIFSAGFIQRTLGLPLRLGAADGREHLG